MTPIIQATKQNEERKQELNLLVKLFEKTVKQSQKTKKWCCLCRNLFCCCNSCFKEYYLFGLFEQQQLLLKSQYGSTHYYVNNDVGCKLDVMFFPCTKNDSEYGSKQPEGDYMEKPTFIMCNPNALIYQQMVISPNNYWLSFFLKREINVVCWNYRGYGNSESRWWENIDPYKCKVDVEIIF